MKANLGTVPDWAGELIERVCRDHGRRPPRIETWRNRSDIWASGCAWPDGRISITAGASRLDTQLVVLHELAHYLTRQRGQHSRHIWHGRRFWERAWDLYVVYGIPLDYAWGRQKDYRGGDRWCPEVIRRAVHPTPP